MWVKSDLEHRCVVLPFNEPEKAEQVNPDHAIRNLKKHGSRRYGPILSTIRLSGLSRSPLLKAEWNIISKYLDKWDVETIQ